MLILKAFLRFEVLLTMYTDSNTLVTAQTLMAVGFARFCYYVTNLNPTNSIFLSEVNSIYYI